MKSVYRILNRERGRSKTTDYLGYTKYEDIPDGITSLKRLLRLLRGKTKWIKVVEQQIIKHPYNYNLTEFIIEFELK